MFTNDPQLIDDSVTTRLIRMILDLDGQQRLALLKELEEMSVIATFNDKRGHARKPVAMTISFSCNGRHYSGITQDLSNGGMFIQTNGNFTTGQTIALFMPFHNRQKPLEAGARIIRVEKDGIGVTLTHKK